MNNTYDLNYEFRLTDSPVKFFNISLDQQTLCVISKTQNEPPDWARLEFHQCKCCTLTTADNKYCPICLNISEIVEEFKDIKSIDKCVVQCTTPERTVFKDTDVQDGLSSILGIFMATSDCPKMNLLKPMARFHLPFATGEETIIRSTSFFLLRQYFEYRNGNISDINLKGMDEYYREIQLVNAGILTRINAITLKDADSNAIIILNSLAELLVMACENSLDFVKNFFQSR
ncbi:hypothetical protein KAH55_13355 [bacterium]|nr:hypothetical protein [bacterium]